MSVGYLREADQPECDNCGVALERDLDGEGRCNSCTAPIPLWEPTDKSWVEETPLPNPTGKSLDE